MNIATRLSVFTALLAGLVVPAASAAADWPEVAVKTDLSFASRYVYRGVQLARASLEPSLDLSAGDGYLGLWGNLPTGTGGQKNELDFYAGRTFPVSRPEAGWKLDLGARGYYFPQSYYAAGQSNTSVEGYAGIAGGAVGPGLTPKLYSAYDFTRQNWNVIGSLGAALPVEKLGFALEFDVHVGHTGIHRGSDYTYWGAGVVLPYRIANNATLTLGAQYDSSNLKGAQHNLVTWTAGMSVGF